MFHSFVIHKISYGAVAARLVRKGEKGVSEYRLKMMNADSNDLEVYEKLAASARERGFDGMSLGCLAEHTRQQEEEDLEDSWLRFSAGLPAFMKITETSVVHGVLSKEHIEKNRALARAKSDILEKYGLKGAAFVLEPMWLPESFYEKHPHARGARCDNPCLALKDYYSPCIDDEEILQHYREGMKALVELAPAIATLSIGTNDSGAGVCWGSGLYPGPNGPDHCREVPMGTRISRWLQAMLDGAKDAGHDVYIFFSPVHFSRAETKDTAEKVPEGASLTAGGNYPDVDRVMRERGHLVAAGTNPTMVPWCFSPLVETPFPYYNLEAMQKLHEAEADVISVGGFMPPIHGIDTVSTMAILSGLHEPPKSELDIEQRVKEIAVEHVGEDLCHALTSAWREVDHALRIWFGARAGDTNHLLHPQYSVKGARWMIRPIVPDPSKIPDEEKEYYRRHLHHSRTSEEPDNFFMWESAINYRIDEMKWPVALYNEIIRYMDRATKFLDDAEETTQSLDETTRKRWRLLCDRVAALKAVWRTQRNVLRAQSIIEFFTGDKQDEYRHVIRRDESFHEPPTYRRFFLEAMQDEIENAREYLRLIREQEVEIFETGEVETTFVLPRDLGELIEKKIALIEAHMDDIDILFGDVGPERYADPTYEWADVNAGNEKEKREKDRAKMGE